MRRAVLVVVSLAFVLPVPNASARQADPRTEPPVSIARIRRALHQPHQEQPLNRLPLAYYVSVTADAPPPDLFKEFDWKHGPVPGAPPSHQEMLHHLTPQEFSAPAADLTWLGTWLASKVSHRKSGS